MIELEAAGLRRDASVLDIASPHPVCLEENCSIKQLVELMLNTGLRRIPILSKQKLIGILTTWDVLDAFLRREDFDQPVGRIAVRDVIVCSAQESVEDVLYKFKLSRRGGFPVLKDGKVVGMVTEHDFIKRFAHVRFNVQVSDAMTPNPLFLTPKLSLLECFRSLVSTRFRRLPIVEQKKLVGILTTADILRYLHEHAYDWQSLERDSNTLIKKEVFTIEPEAELSDAIKLMLRQRVGGLVVSKEGEVKGILTERDILVEIV